MTVKELIEALESAPPEAMVFLEDQAALSIAVADGPPRLLVIRSFGVEYSTEAVLYDETAR